MHRLSARSPIHFTFVLLFLFASAGAALAGPVTGRIVDADGRPVSGARVLVSGDDVRLASAITDEDGRFSVDAPDDVRLVVRIAADGFRAEARAVDASAQPRDVGTIALAVGALSESVVVSASQVEVPLTQVASSVTIITGAELESRQLNSVAEALRTVPGMTVTSTGGVGTNTGVFPRGGESNYSLVLIDGVPANAFGGDFDFGQVSTANVERIEIVRGPQSALYGSNAIGSVVRIITRAGGAPAAQFSAEGGHQGSSRVSGSSAGRRGAFEWGALFDQVLSDGSNGERTAAGDDIVNDDYERRSGAISAGWRRGAAAIRGDARYSTDERGFPGPFGSNPIGAYEGIDAVSRGRNDRAVASLSVSGPITPRLRGQAQAGYSRLESDFASPFGGSESFSRRWIGRAQADIMIGRGLDASAGVEVQREHAGSTFITGSTAERIPITRTIAGYFAEARWNSRDRLFLTTGLRVEEIGRDGIEPSPDAFSPRPPLPSDTVVSANPRLSGAWIVRGGGASFTKLRAATGTGIRPPDAFELAFTDNPGLKPERSASAEAGIDQAFAGGRGLIEATAFFSDYDDLIVAVGSFSGSSRFRTDNISNARARGLELALTLRGRVQRARAIDLAGRVGYTLLDTEVLAVDQDDTAPPPFVVGQALLRRPKHQFFADLSMSSGPLAAFLRGGGRSRTLDVEPSLGTFGGLFDAAGHQVWSAGASWRLGRFTEVFGRVENIFDRTYEEAFGFPAPGRRATAGLRIAAGR
ncbi:MAG: TonB-dependent receptor [Vicinamibacterales bacterium]